MVPVRARLPRAESRLRILDAMSLKNGEHIRRQQCERLGHFFKQGDVVAGVEGDAEEFAVAGV